jgi:hypothetical protein
MVVATVPLMAQVTVGGLMDLEFRMSGSDSNPYVNGSPSPKPTLYLPNARLFVDAPIDDEWSFFGVLQSDHYGSKSFNPPFFSLMQVTWTPFERDVAFHAGRIIIPFGLTSERFLSSENPLRHLPLSHEWTTRVDKKAGLVTGPRDYVAAPGMTFVYSRMYTHGIAMQGTFGMLDAHLALTQNAPSGFNEGGEYDVPSFVGRIGLTPAVWMRIGASFGHGPYMKEDATNRDVLTQADRESLTQTIFGTDVTFDYAYVRVSYEYMRSAWKTVEIRRDVAPPTVSAPWSVPADAHSVEAVWDVSALPGLYAAARYDRMTVHRYAAGVGEFERLETGFGYKLTRSVTAKATYARARNQGTDLADDVLGVQLSITF